MSTTTYSSNNVLNAVAAASQGSRRAQGGSEPPERVPGARRRHRHEHVAHHPVGGQQRGEPSHRCLGRRHPQGRSPPAPSWVPAATPASSLPRSCAAYARAARASTSSNVAVHRRRLRSRPSRWPSRPCASRWKARSSRCCAIPPPPPRWPSSRSFPSPRPLDAIVAEAYASVQRTPDLLPVLKEHGVVDAGGFGLAILFDAFTAALLGRSGTMVDEHVLRPGVAPQGGDRAGERLGGLPVPLLQRVPRGFRYPGQGRRA